MTAAPWDHLSVTHTETLAEEFDRKMRSDSPAALRRVFYLGAELQRRAERGDVVALQFWRGALANNVA